MRMARAGVPSDIFSSTKQKLRVQKIGLPKQIENFDVIFS